LFSGRRSINWGIIEDVRSYVDDVESATNSVEPAVDDAINAAV
jgi:hypothetical protein